MTPSTSLSFDGIEQPITEWALDYGIAPAVIIARLERGLSVDQAITTPMVTARGQKLTGKHLDRYIFSQGATWRRDRRKVIRAVEKASREAARQAVREEQKAALAAKRPARTEQTKAPHKPRADARLFTFDNETMTLGEWAQELSISLSTLEKRVAAGWPIERVLTEENTADAKARRYAFNGETLTIRQWSERTGLATSVIDTRLRKGWSIERALTAPVDERMRRRRGVGQNLAQGAKTGGVSFAHDRTELEFSE